MPALGVLARHCCKGRSEKDYYKNRDLINVLMLSNIRFGTAIPELEMKIKAYAKTLMDIADIYALNEDVLYCFLRVERIVSQAFPKEKVLALLRRYFEAGKRGSDLALQNYVCDFIERASENASDSEQVLMVRILDEFADKGHRESALLLQKERFQRMKVAPAASVCL